MDFDQFISNASIFPVFYKEKVVQFGQILFAVKSNEKLEKWPKFCLILLGLVLF